MDSLGEKLPGKPLVSVIIPNYNHAGYLPQRIESVLKQTHHDFELIILDDCSTDNSRAIISDYGTKDNRIQIIFNEQNSGSTFRQWRKGLQVARGKYVWIAESDDFAELTFLEKLVPVLQADDTIAFAYANSAVVDEVGHASGTTADWKNELFATNHWGQDFIVDGRQELAHYLSQTCTVNNASAVLFRRSSLDQVGGVDTDFRYTGDWMLYVKLSLAGKIAYIAQCLSNYREHSANASKKSLVDSSQLFERQKCFAYVYHTQALDATAQDKLLKKASEEYMAILYNLLRRQWQPGKLLEYVRKIWAIDNQFFLKVQSSAIVRTLRRAY